MIVAATGHRPYKLSGFTIHQLVDLAMRYMQRKGVTEAVSGLALGWDTAWALAALELNIPLIAMAPFSEQEKLWDSSQRRLYRRLCEEATKFIVVGEEYSLKNYQLRNERMVDYSDRMAALWNGTKGGTHNCLMYAVKQNKPIDNLWDELKGHLL